MTGSDEALDPDFAGTVLRDLGAGVFTMDSAGLITYVNPWAERLLARTMADMLGRDAHDLLHRRPDGSPVPRERCLLRTPLLGNRDAEEGSDEYFLRGDGTTVPIIWTTTPLALKDRQAGLVVVFSDYSAHRDAERRAAAHMAALEALTDRLNLLADVSTALISSMDAGAVAHRLLPLLVPDLGDWAALDLVAAGSGALERVAVCVPAQPDLAKRLEGPLPQPAERQRREAARGDEPFRVTADEVHRARAPLAASHRVLFQQLGGACATVVPVHSRRRDYGMLTVARCGDGPGLGEAEVRLLADISGRLALVLDNTRLYDEQRDVAETMQRQLLAPLPQVDHLRMAARYLPAQSAMEIGGDWYDAFLLADGVMALVIGDVVGHDLQAAAHMAEVRNMLRALAWTHVEPPSMIMRRLDEAVTHTSDAPMATLVFARVEGPEGGPWRLRWVNAGHPPPLLVTREGETRFLTGGHGPLIGMSATLHLGLSWPDTHEDLPPEATLLFYTDGLVESRGRPIDAGMAKLRHHAGVLARGLPETTVDVFCDQLLERLSPSGDDTALLALRLPPAGAGAPGDQNPPPPPQSPRSPAAPDRDAPGSVQEQAPVKDPTREAREPLRDPRRPTD
ncbi:SpoIIE family protein phosphatase [Streptomyces sp. LP11]|uniref:SpoIIE family protein phosphatase n=1 Tax=Streptomyces pyxinicus TaxID=2970331 RepID=A0ABT2B3H8_9ACTN|nr:SpoIIE family protein phosphatase [Streptomyces sp. LP11]MCS0603056.1 SpoIIE family protein phosphatase [Streptomyces sp. LP11]